MIDDFYDGLKDSRNYLYKQIDTVALLNKLFTTLYTELNNINNYMINIIGDNSYLYKIFLKNLYKDLDQSKNKIERLIKIKKGYPVYNLNDIETISMVKTLPSMDYKINIIENNIRKDLSIIKNIMNEIIDNAKKENDYLTIHILCDLEVKILLDNYTNI